MQVITAAPNILKVLNFDASPHSPPALTSLYDSRKPLFHLFHHFGCVSVVCVMLLYVVLSFHLTL